ncbi:MAG: ribonuclease P protein component [Burkholderiaceae bacterium]
MQRLKTREQFQAVLACDTVARSAHFALHRLMLESPVDGAPATVPAGPVREPALGALVPKRWARRAVTRNAIKRQVHAVGAAFEARLPRAARVVRLRSTFDRQQFQSAASEPLKRAVRAELEQLFARALKPHAATPTGAKA